MTFTVQMVLERVTKGALLYREVDSEGKPRDWGHKIGRMYIRKEATGGAEHRQIEVTVATPAAKKAAAK